MNSKVRNFFLVTFLMFVSVIILNIYPANALTTEKHWSYGGAENPSQWGELQPEYQLCATGKDQSPIDLNPQILPENSSPIQFKYQETPLVIVNNGHTIQVNYQPGSYAAIDGEKYELIQFHFHTPSEHTINKKASAMELHLVHKNQAGKLAVIGVLIKEGNQNSELAKIWGNISAEKGENQLETIQVNANDLLPMQHSYYHYLGSLTTPPCSEKVNWNVMLNPIEASPEQIREFMQFYQVNARPIQSLNARKIELRK